MEKNTANSHVHITAEQLRTVNSMDADNLDRGEIALLHSILAKTEECPVCRARYDFAMETDQIFTLWALRADELPPAEQAARLLSEKLGSLEQGLREKVSRWLNGAQDCLTSFGSVSLRPAFAGRTRGERPESREIACFQSADGAPCLDFTLAERTPVLLRVSAAASGSRPVCLILIGREGTAFGEIYPLADPLASLGQRGGEAKLSSPIIQLEAGEYSAIIPTA